MSDDIKQGCEDCERGLPAKEGMSEAYCQGYAMQYAIEQQQSQGQAN